MSKNCNLAFCECPHTHMANDFITPKLPEEVEARFDERFVYEQAMSAEGPAIGSGKGSFKHLKNDLYGVKHFLATEVALSASRAVQE